MRKIFLLSLVLCTLMLAAGCKTAPADKEPEVVPSGTALEPANGGIPIQPTTPPDATKSDSEANLTASQPSETDKNSGSGTSVPTQPKNTSVASSVNSKPTSRASAGGGGGGGSARARSGAVVAQVIPTQRVGTLRQAQSATAKKNNTAENNAAAKSEAEKKALAQKKAQEERAAKEAAAKAEAEKKALAQKKAQEQQAAKEAAAKKAQEERDAKEAAAKAEAEKKALAQKKAQEQRAAKEAAAKKAQEERAAKEAAAKAEAEKKALAQKKAQEERAAKEAAAKAEAEKKAQEQQAAKEAAAKKATAQIVDVSWMIEKADASFVSKHHKGEGKMFVTILAKYTGELTDEDFQEAFFSSPLDIWVLNAENAKNLIENDKKNKLLMLKHLAAGDGEGAVALGKWFISITLVGQKPFEKELTVTGIGGQNIVDTADAKGSLKGKTIPRVVPVAKTADEQQALSFPVVYSVSRDADTIEIIFSINDSRVKNGYFYFDVPGEEYYRDSGSMVDATGKPVNGCRAFTTDGNKCQYVLRKDASNQDWFSKATRCFFVVADVNRVASPWEERHRTISPVAPIVK